MLRPFRALLLDLDGTLVDSRGPTERAWRDWAFDRGLEASADEIARTCHGVPSVQHVATWAPSLDAAAESAVIEAAQVASTEPVTAFAMGAELLDLMPPGRVAVVTSGTPDLASTRMAAAGLTPPALMVRAGDVEHGKPGPDPYLRGAELLNLPPADRLGVEDAPAGVTSGLAAGCQVVGVAHTHSCVELEGAHA